MEKEIIVEELWRRINQSRHIAVLGIAPGEPPPDLGLRVLRVSCDVPKTTLGPILDANRKVERVLGEPALRFERARERVVAGLRRRLLGDAPATTAEDAAVELWNRLARSSDRPVVLLFDAVDAADDATLELLHRVVSRPGWLRSSLVLCFRSSELAGAAAALVDAMRAAHGPESIMTCDGHPAAEPVTAPAFDTRALPHDVLRVLRAGAVVGSGFETDLVAALLDLDPLEVLDRLQRASDAGVPIDDRGEDRFHLPAPVIESLRASILPSQLRAWHMRFAEMLSGGPLEQPAAPRPDRAQDAPIAAPIEPQAAPEESNRTSAEAPAEAPPATRDPEMPPHIAIDESAAAAQVSAAAGAGPWVTGYQPPSFAAEPRASTPRAASVAPKVDEARAAGHLAAAGELERGAERYLAALREAEAKGAFPQAVAFGRQALALLERLPISDERRRMRARALIEIGRLQWQGAGPGGAFTLERALEALEEARASLRDGDPPALRAETSALIAGVCYDVGDLGSLERALDELTGASRLLLDAGDAVGAARLLNDQAAVYVRMGDPVRAVHLLDQSRAVFERKRDARDPGAPDAALAMELAETDHLLARIPLHVQARTGMESDAMTMGIDHALAAERTYQRLGATREIARVWETIGRLELRKGRLDRASARLTKAIAVQDSVGDVVGLARTTAALSEVLAASGRHRDALAMLGDSIALNVEKGSPIGLAFNRRAFDALARGAAPAGELEGALREVSERLSAAESTLGASRLPGEGD